MYTRDDRETAKIGDRPYRSPQVHRDMVGILGRVIGILEFEKVIHNRSFKRQRFTARTPLNKNVK